MATRTTEGGLCKLLPPPLFPLYDCTLFSPLWYKGQRTGPYAGDRAQSRLMRLGLVLR